MIMTEYKVGTPEFEDAFNRMIATWSKAYRLTLRTRQAKRKRLDELLTWDKATENNKWEHTAKVTALDGLLNDDYKPKSKRK
jgi:phage-related protein